MKKLLLTMLVALLALPAFADGLEPASTVLDGDSLKLTTPTTTNPYVTTANFTQVGSYFQTDGTDGYTKPMKATIKSKNWTRPLKSVDLKIESLVRASLSGAAISVAVYDPDDDSGPYTTTTYTSSQMAGYAGGGTLSVPVYIEGLAEYYITVAVSVAVNKSAGAVKFESITYHFAELSEAENASISWDKNEPGGGFTIPINATTVTIANTLPIYVDVTPASGMSDSDYTVKFEATTDDGKEGNVISLTHEGLDVQYKLLRPGTATVTATLCNSEGIPVEVDNGAVSASFHLTVTAIQGSLAWSVPTATVTLGSEGTYPTLTKKINGVVNNTLPVSFKSSDETVATVNENGVVTPLKAGTTTITAYVEDSDYEVTPVSYTLTVNAKKATLTWSAESYTAYLGATNTFPTLTVDPEDVPVKYDSSNRDIADVDNDGNVTLKTTGSVTITAFIDTAAEGGKDYAAASATYTLVVNNGFDWASDAVTSGTYYYGQVFDLPKVVPATGVSGDIKVEYSASPDNVISIGDGTAKVIGVATGNITITATASVGGTNLGSLSYTITTTPVYEPKLSFGEGAQSETVVYTATNIELPALVVKASYDENAPTLDLDMSKVDYEDNAGETANVEKIGDNYYLVFANGYVPNNSVIKVTATLPRNPGLSAQVSATYSITVKPAIAWNGPVKDVYEGKYEDGTDNKLVVPTVENYAAGEGVTVTYSCTPANGVITVNPVSGAVTMVGPGNAVVTATATKEGVEVQKLSYNVTVTKNYADYTMYLTSQDFATGTKPNPTITATIVGSDQPVDVKFTGSFTKTDDGVVKVDGNRFSATNYSTAAQQAYSSVKVIGSGVGGGTLETSLLPDFKIITETVDSDNGVFPITQTLHGLYYRLTNVTAETLSSIEFIPSADQTILTNATAYYIIATQSEANKPEVIVNYELAATSNSISGKSPAYPNGQAVLLNFKPAKDETLYFICKHGDNYYAPTYQIIDKPIVAGVNYYNIEAGHAGYPDNEIFPIYQDKFVGGLSSIEYNEYQENQYIRIGDDDVLDNPVVYYYTVKTVNSRAANNIQSSLLRTLSFTQTTGVEDVMVDEPTAEPVYYNLQGVQIAHPAKGQIYVRVRGQKVDKVVF